MLPNLDCPFATSLAYVCMGMKVRSLISRYNAVMASRFFDNQSYRRIVDESGLMICLQPRGCAVDEEGDTECFPVDDGQWFHVGCQTLQKPLDGV